MPIPLRTGRNKKKNIDVHKDKFTDWKWWKLAGLSPIIYMWNLKKSDLLKTVKW